MAAEVAKHGSMLVHNQRLQNGLTAIFTDAEEEQKQVNVPVLANMPWSEPLEGPA